MASDRTNFTGGPSVFASADACGEGICVRGGSVCGNRHDHRVVRRADADGRYIGGGKRRSARLPLGVTSAELVPGVVDGHRLAVGRNPEVALHLRYLSLVGGRCDVDHELACVHAEPYPSSARPERLLKLVDDLGGASLNVDIASRLVRRDTVRRDRRGNERSPLARMQRWRLARRRRLVGASFQGLSDHVSVWLDVPSTRSSCKWRSSRIAERKHSRRHFAGAVLPRRSGTAKPAASGPTSRPTGHIYPYTNEVSSVRYNGRWYTNGYGRVR